MAKKTKKRTTDIDDDPQFATTREEANARLRLFIDRIIRLEEEKKGMADDIKDVYTELKSSGYDGTTTRRMVALAKMTKDARDEKLALEDTYRAELGF
jgi:uncharacterized protein (UPF0335 family)